MAEQARRYRVHYLYPIRGTREIYANVADEPGYRRLAGTVELRSPTDRIRATVKAVGQVAGRKGAGWFWPLVILTPDETETRTVDEAVAALGGERPGEVYIVAPAEAGP
ncbi:MAG TPA: hypothetical protein VHL09_15675 [Dehalococcoidia bacterium]|nr:hypothetical protein [Dehalococcoidia bacterium]